MSHEITPFVHIRRTNPAGNEFWSSRDFARVLGYNDYRNFEAVVQKARTACFNSGQRVEDHFVDVTDMIEIGKGGQRAVKTVMMSRYAYYLLIQNADPAKEIVAQGQTYFAVQTRRQELSDDEIENQRRLAIRSELRMHNMNALDFGLRQPCCRYRTVACCGVITDQNLWSHSFFHARQATLHKAAARLPQSKLSQFATLTEYSVHSPLDFSPSLVIIRFRNVTHI